MQNSYQENLAKRTLISRDDRYFSFRPTSTLLRPVSTQSAWLAKLILFQFSQSHRPANVPTSKDQCAGETAKLAICASDSRRVSATFLSHITENKVLFQTAGQRQTFRLGQDGFFPQMATYSGSGEVLEAGGVPFHVPQVLQERRVRRQLLRHVPCFLHRAKPVTGCVRFTRTAAWPAAKWRHFAPWLGGGAK